ncbi:MAG: TM0106 family RecB-like putative nuclease [Elusimicrobia bacterium]|nr:TM0106 family RecB-like putative nuclease [Elusimicrobiota bacterium]
MEFEDQVKEVEEKSRRLSPTLISQASRCLHFYFLEEFGDPSLKLPESAGQKLTRDRGKEFERQVVATLPEVAEPKWDRGNFRHGYEATLKLMEKGVSWIHGGALMDENIVGVPDLLQKMPGKSKLGDYFYVPIEIKSHREVQKRDILQVAAYSLMLEKAQGFFSKKGGVWLNTGNIAEVDITASLSLLQKLRDQMGQVTAKKFATEPIWCAACVMCPWLANCKKQWKQMDHLSLLPNGGQSTIKKLYLVGIKTVNDLAQADPEQISKKTKMSEKTAQKLWLHAKARTTGKPIVIKKPDFMEDRPILFWDIETHGSVLFLHGLISLFNGKREEQFFFADSPDQEAQIWHDFLDHIGQYDDAVIFDWADYERPWAVACWKKYGGNERVYKHLMKNLIDQCRWTQEHFAFPTRSYSIKEIAPVFNFHWQAADAGGMNAEAWYGEWLRDRDKALKEKILVYNKDDVDAMLVIYEKLKILCKNTV